MAVLKSAEAVDAWLARAGWHPGRRRDGLAAAKVAAATEEYRLDGGGVLEVNRPALEFVREHIGLAAPLHAGPEDVVHFSPEIMYEGVSEFIQDLAEGLGKTVFPVAHDTFDAGTILIDEAGRFFYLHHTGGYFLGSEKYMALMNYSRGHPLDDAEDYYV